MTNNPIGYKRELASKARSLRTSKDPGQLALASSLAQSAVDLSPDKNLRKWARLAWAMAAYRRGEYLEADREFMTFDRHTEDYQERFRTAQIYHAMCLFRLGRRAEARAIFDKASLELPPFPEPLSREAPKGGDYDHRVMVPWLAIKEAREMFNESPADH